MLFKKKSNTTFESPIDEMIIGRFRLKFAGITAVLIFAVYMMATPEVVATQGVPYIAMFFVSIFAAQIGFFIGHLLSRFVRRDRILDRARATGQYFKFG